MPFFPEIDTKKTKDLVKRKLREIPRLRRMAGDSHEQRVTATYSIEPRQPLSSPSRMVEKLVINKVSIEQDLDSICDAINSISNDHYRQVIIEKYWRIRNRRVDDIELYMTLGHSETEFYRLEDKGLLEFAECYNRGELLIFKP